MVCSGLCSNLWCTSNLSPVMQERNRNLCQQFRLARRRRCRALQYIWRQMCKTLHISKGLNYLLNTQRNVLWLQGGVRAKVPKPKPGFPYSRGWPVMEKSSCLPVQWLAARLSYLCDLQAQTLSPALRLFAHFEIYPWASSSAEPTQHLCGAWWQQQRANWHWRPSLHSTLPNYHLRDLYAILAVSLKE